MHIPAEVVENVAAVSHNPTPRREIASFISLLYDPRNAVPVWLADMTLERLLWAVTESDDDRKYSKYFAQPYWSKCALVQYRENKARRIRLDQDLRHDHAVPRNELRARLALTDKSNADAVAELFDLYAYAVVLTKSEHARLGQAGLGRKLLPGALDNWSKAAVFERHRSIGIQVMDIRGIELDRAANAIDRGCQECIS